MIKPDGVIVLCSAKLPSSSLPLQLRWLLYYTACFRLEAKWERTYRFVYYRYAASQAGCKSALL